MFEQYFDPEQIKFRGKPKEQRIPRVRAPRIRSNHVGRPSGPTRYTYGKQQRVTFVSSYGNANPALLKRHVSYLESDFKGIDGKKAELFTEEGKELPTHPIENETRTFRFILSPENGDQLKMKDFTREFMQEYEEASGKKLQWLATVHYNTAHPHAHILVRGVDQNGDQFLLSKDLLNNHAREIASELATHQIGLRSDRDILIQQSREIVSDRFTSIDRSIYNKLEGRPHAVALTSVQKQRLEFLDRKMNLAKKVGENTFELDPRWRQKLEFNGRRGDVIATIQNDLPPNLRDLWKDRSSKKPLSIYQNSWSIQGTILTKGISDEMHDVPYAVIESKNRLYYYSSNKHDLSDFKVGAQVKIDHGKFVDKSQHIEQGQQLAKDSQYQGNMPSFRKTGPHSHGQGIER